MESPEVRNAIEQGYMRALEVADYLGITQQRVSQLAAGGRLPGAADRGRPASVEAVSGGTVG